LRLSDNPALTAASQQGSILPIYILDDKNACQYAMGAASNWWLHHSLVSLNESLNGKLSIYKGNPIDILIDLICRFDVKSIHWNRCYEPWRIHRDAMIKKYLMAMNIEVGSYNGSLLWEPWTIKKDDGEPYKVFTPFYRKGCLQTGAPREPLPIPKKIAYNYDQKSSLCVNNLKLLPKNKWDSQLEKHWKIGEKAGQLRFKNFLNKGLIKYKDGRNFPGKPYVSRLSPHLHFGEISANQLWFTIQSITDNKNSDHFCSELGWREFSYSQLYYSPDLPTKNQKSKFDLFPWVTNEIALDAWKKGQTGVPMVDAGMRELWNTGYMHNRVRMIVGSFLVKNLLQHWRHGERWFWNTLVDADLANNSASWQWVAGCGADAAPYFRIFNPVTQGQKFDPDGSYVRSFIPEIKSLPDKYLFNPWDAPEHVLKEVGIEIGTTYPKPIVDLKLSRTAALEAFQSL
jgi:deoxyribodipyrimidine photo-lyase